MSTKEDIKSEGLEKEISELEEEINKKMVLNEQLLANMEFSSQSEESLNDEQKFLSKIMHILVDRKALEDELKRWKDAGCVATSVRDKAIAEQKSRIGELEKRIKIILDGSLAEQQYKRIVELENILKTDLKWRDAAISARQDNSILQEKIDALMKECGDRGMKKGELYQKIDEQAEKIKALETAMKLMFTAKEVDMMLKDERKQFEAFPREVVDGKKLDKLVAGIKKGYKKRIADLEADRDKRMVYVHKLEDEKLVIAKNCITCRKEFNKSLTEENERLNEAKDNLAEAAFEEGKRMKEPSLTLADAKGIIEKIEKLKLYAKCKGGMVFAGNDESGEISVLKEDLDEMLGFLWDTIDFFKSKGVDLNYKKFEKEMAEAIADNMKKPSGNEVKEAKA